MWIQKKALRAPGARSAGAVACGVVLAGLVSPRAWADDQLGPLVVTATRTPQSVNRTLADVSVVTRETIERQGAGSVADVLRTLPGVQITRNGDAGATTSVMIRGSNARHVLVLVDGVPMGSQASGGATWESLPLAWVDHIEVVRGPASAAYGSEAMGGVVQIFTRKGRGAPHIELGLGVSDQSMLNADVSAAGGEGAWDYLVGVAGEASHSFNAKSNTVPGTAAADRDGHASNSSHVKVGWQADSNQRVQASLSHMHLDNQFDNSSASALDDRAKKDSNVAGLNWAAQWLPGWRMITTLGQGTDAYELRSSYKYHTNTRTQNAAVVNQWSVDGHELRAILERREDHLLNSDLPLLGADGRGDQKTNGLGLGYEWQGRDLGLGLNWRQDDNNRFGLHHTGSASTSVVLAPGQRLRASVGSAFRGPTVYQLFSSSGDPTLQPETSVSQELGYTVDVSGINLGVTGFRNRYDQLIDYDFNKVCWTGYAGCYDNTARARIDGLTFSMDGLVDEVRVMASLDLLNPVDTVKDKWLPRRARQEAKLRAEWTAMDWDLGAQVQLTGQRYDDPANTKKLGGYALYGLDASRKVNTDLTVIAKVSNLSNHGYQTALNYNTEPRTVFVGLRWAPAR